VETSRNCLVALLLLSSSHQNSRWKKRFSDEHKTTSLPLLFSHIVILFEFSLLFGLFHYRQLNPAPHSYSPLSALDWIGYIMDGNGDDDDDDGTENEVEKQERERAEAAA